MTFATTSRKDLGADIMCEHDLDPGLRLVTGTRNVAWDIAWRIQTVRGGLFYDANYGAGMIESCHDVVDRRVLSTCQATIQAELRKDDRILSSTTSVRWSPATRTMSSELVCTSAAGPFRLVANVSEADTVVRVES